MNEPLNLPEATASAIGEGIKAAPSLMTAFLQGIQTGFQAAKLEEQKEAR